MIPGVVGFPRSPIMLIEDSESNIYMSFRASVKRWVFTFNEGYFRYYLIYTVKELIKAA